MFGESMQQVQSALRGLGLGCMVSVCSVVFGPGSRHPRIVGWGGGEGSFLFLGQGEGFGCVVSEVIPCIPLC